MVSNEKSKKVTSFNCADLVFLDRYTSVGLAFHFVKNVSVNGKLLVFCPKNALGSWDDEYKEILKLMKALLLD